MNQLINKLLVNSVMIFLALVSLFCRGEDIELYTGETVIKNQVRPKVLIIFDNSGSMGNQEEYKQSYNPTIDYPALDGLSKRSAKYIYYSKGGDSTPIPDSISENRLFRDQINGCKTARDILNTYGIYTGRVKEYTFQGNSGRWAEIPDNSGLSIQLLDCEDDVNSENSQNRKIKSDTGSIVNLPAPQNGFPVDALGDKDSPIYYTTQVQDSNVSWSGRLVTLYTDNYLRWQQNDNIIKVWKSRMDEAKESVTTLINSSPNVDFGLQVFNRNNGSNYRNGGRIVHSIQESTPSSRSKLLEILTDDITPKTWTPLCESLYEATRYFGGKSVYYGNDDDITPKRDKTIEESKVYKSPFNTCSDRIYVVLITDGEPTYDFDAVDEIFALPASGQEAIGLADRFYVGGNSDLYAEYSYLAALAGWISNNDLNLNLDGKQTANTYTIGFSQGVEGAEELLQETADLGQGDYYYAADSADLTSKLSNVLQSLDASNESFTAASIAANTLNQTETLDSVYHAMFQPDRGPRWQGNLKKYKIVNGTQLGVNKVKAVTDDGYFSEDVQSYWSDNKDGNSVQEGGVAEMLRKKTNRTLLSDLGADNTLVDLTYSEASNSDIFSTSAELASALDVIDDESIITDMLHWINGRDMDDVDNDGITSAENRPDVFGDPLHSRPVAINYGDNNIYLVVGTNHGVIHMFKDDDSTNKVNETWAFMPKKFIPNIKPLRDNFTSTNKIYGADGQITQHVIDYNGDGIVNGTDKVWLFFGFRRGGNLYYAMDVTNPAEPKIMWTIEGGSGDFNELGQTWSQPKIIFTKLNTVGVKPKPTLLFGGGYDPIKDAKSVGGIGDADTQGKAIYMVDAQSGELVWRLAPGGDTVFVGKDSIPASVASLDSDSDGFVDRLYAGDTGGNVWRVDVPGSDKSKFSVFKLASLGNGGGTGGTQANDRRFFSEPDIVRAYITETINSGKKDLGGKDIIVQQDIPYDAILLGSGDRTNPLGSDNDDKFFMIKDNNIKTQQFIPTTPIPTTITLNDLADYTDNPFGQLLTTQEKESLALQVSQKKGWFIDLELSGEKSTSPSVTLKNTVYFSSYTPPSDNIESDSCKVSSGKGWLYAVDLELGISRYNWSQEDARNRKDTIKFVSTQMLSSSTIFRTSFEDPDTGEFRTVSKLCTGSDCDDDIDPPTPTLRSYLYVDEN
jgi:type IV pilus assembly protein PilY1